jgi:hypothetical protein
MPQDKRFWLQERNSDLLGVDPKHFNIATFSKDLLANFKL